MRNDRAEFWRPEPFGQGRGFDARLRNFKKKRPGLVILDRYEEYAEEIFFLRNPRFRFEGGREKELAAFWKKHLKDKVGEEKGEWFYFPWRNQLAHYLSHALHQELRTGRNRYLITDEEQKIFYGAKVGILGLSVGNHAALTLAISGGTRNMNLADPDAVSGDNLNRIRAGFLEVGTNKAIMTARQIFEINPYARISLFRDGLREENVEQFLDGLNALIEEMDNPFWKLAVRVMARARRIPVIMGTDNGDGIIVDIERFDKEPKLPILHGAVGNLNMADLRSMDPRDLPRIAARIAGANMASPRMLHSVTEVGKSIYSWPQLGTAANLCGSAVAYLVKEIVLGNKDIRSGRYEINLDAIFQADYYSRREIKIREAARKKFFNVMRK